MKNIVVLVSGGGTNLQALIDAEKRGEIKNGKITCVIASVSYTHLDVYKRQALGMVVLFEL